MSCKLLGEIVGRRIVSVVAKTGDLSPYAQVFLVFEDGSSYEFFSVDGSISGSWMHRRNGIATALEYLPENLIVERHPAE